MEVLALVYRNLRARPVRSILTLLGIVVSTASMVLFLSFGEGLRRALSSELSSVGPAILVLPEGVEAFSPGYPELGPDTVRKLEGLAGELGIVRAIPYVVLTRGGFDPQSTFIFQGLPDGVSPKTLYPHLTVRQGALTPSPRGAVVGSRIAERNRLTLGKTLRLSPRVSLRVEGILQPVGGLSDNVIYVPASAVRAALDTPNYTAIALSLHEGSKAEEVAKAIQERIPGVSAQTTGDVLRFAERAVRISDLVRFGISLVALVVGGLLVANTVMMSVYERIREFGLMRALGAKRGFIFGLVLLEALWLGLAGGLVGLGLGGLASAAVNWYTVREVGLALSAVTFRLALFAMLVAVVLGLLAGFLPARTASRIPVVEALGRI
ncbi:MULTISPECIES: ABC transporter permease [unclassified Meiothermus]|uniref:ABC transporter permease n=1 Tax=unclassified Meiothermus TaxID=370471 RepID=UPI000D7CA14B|nr:MULTISPECIES: ABC transporter permease [unclassified Meiothermus]PZA06376.1 ABC transporter permease [Meiothermus sp. Pnk-1]RYM37005.1 ABC transporter permease [Meiothermus sp. PNK-Is4]